MLAFLGVPQVLFLALLAAVADAIPVFGVLIATAPAALLALRVSPVTSGLVVGLYLLYQLVENYVIVQRVYRGRCRSPRSRSWWGWRSEPSCSA